MLINVDIKKLKELSKIIKDTSEELENELMIKHENKDFEVKPSLRDLDSKIKGAPNFTYREFIESETATRLNIQNIPGEKEWNNIEIISSQVLHPIRQEFGRIKITSGFRCLELNTVIGSSSKSSHIKGEAVDIKPLEKDVTLLDIIKYIYNNLEFRELILEYGLNGWIHISYRRNSNLKKLKLKDDDHNYSLVSLDYLDKLYT